VPGHKLAGYVIAAPVGTASGATIAKTEGFGAILLLWVLGLISRGETTGWRAGLAYASLLEHFNDFASGVIETRHIVYYVSFAALALFLALRSVESQRWRG